MEFNEYILKLDALVRLIKPGIFFFTVAIIFIEAGILTLRKISWSFDGGAVSLFSAAGVFGLEAAADILFYTTIMYWLYDHRIFELGFAWYIWLACFLVFDLMFYISHRLQHEVRLFWCFHSVHHTTDEMRLSSAVRGPVIEFIFSPWFFIWMPVLGFHPLMFLTVRIFSRVWGILEHVHESFVGYHPWLNKIFITPDVHRVHHGRNHRYLDMNYAEVFSVWDRLFGTYKEYDEKPDYGVLRPLDPDNFLEVQTHAWVDLWRDLKAEKNWLNRFKLLLMPPGWYPDGRDFTAKTLRRSADNQHFTNGKDSEYAL